MELLNNIPPAFLLIIGAIALLALPANARKVGAIALAAIGFFAITQLSEGTRGNPEFLGHIRLCGTSWSCMILRFPFP